MKPSDWWMPDQQQRAFRAVLDGFARPGTLVPAGPSGAMLMFLSAVLDESVSLADPSGLLAADVRRLLLAPSAPVAQAQFVLLDGRTPPEADLRPPVGTLESPELGATLILIVDALVDAPTAAQTDLVLQLQGPGVPGTRALTAAGLHPDWLARRAVWTSAFPMGVDIVLAAPSALVALPRTTRIQITPRSGER